MPWSDLTLLKMIAWKKSTQKKKKGKKKSQGLQRKAYGTWYSQAVSHPSTNQAWLCLAFEIRRFQGDVAVGKY